MLRPARHAKGNDFRGEIFDNRRVALESLVSQLGKQAMVALYEITRDIGTARGWMQLVGGDVDGVVAKRGGGVRRKSGIDC